MTLEIVILAAGQGTRMRSTQPKVLHKLAGKPILQYVLEAAYQLNPYKVHVVVGFQGDEIQQYFSSYPISWVRQAQQLGTGHALQIVLPHLKPTSQVLVLLGDGPLISVQTLYAMQEKYEIATAKLCLLTTLKTDPKGLGRIVRNHQNQVLEIVEDVDCDPFQLAIKEIWTGILLTNTLDLERWLPRLTKQNAAGEFYLTQLCQFARKENGVIETILTGSEHEAMGINDRNQLAYLERYYQQQRVNHWLQQGVTFADPARVDFRGEVELAQDVTVDINVIFNGTVQVGMGCHIGAGSILTDVCLGPGVTVLPYSIIEGATIDQNCVIGPFARIRPGTELSSGAKVGNFVEIKHSKIGKGSKINHLSYIGDATVGREVNIGAGTITCNYDGYSKHPTIIGDRVHVGSNTNLVAPVTVHEEATIGAGSTITKDVGAQQLGLARARQTNIEGWKGPKSQRKHPITEK